MYKTIAGHLVKDQNVLIVAEQRIIPLSKERWMVWNTIFYRRPRIRRPLDVEALTSAPEPPRAPDNLARKAGLPDVADARHWFDTQRPVQQSRF